MSPHGASPQGATSWQVVSPRNATVPSPHFDVGSTGVHPWAPSDTKPVAHAEAGTPAGWHSPFERVSSPGAQAITPPSPPSSEPPSPPLPSSPASFPGTTTVAVSQPVESAAAIAIATAIDRELLDKGQNGSILAASV